MQDSITDPSRSCPSLQTETGLDRRSSLGRLAPAVLGQQYSRTRQRHCGRILQYPADVVRSGQRHRHCRHISSTTERLRCESGCVYSIIDTLY